MPGADRIVCILNFGCKVNQAENLALEEELRRFGIEITDEPLEATDIVVNTCAVTVSAEAQVRRFVRRLVRETSGCRIYLAGCFVDRTAGTPGADLGVTAFFPNAQKQTITRVLIPAAAARPVGRGHLSRTRPILKIQDGCPLACAYCIIPSLRGHTIRSMALEEVTRRITRYRDQPEVILTGVLLGAYGADLTPRTNLAELLDCLAPVGPPPLRLSSIEPWHLDGPLVERFGRHAFVRPHLHIPLQTGSDSVARRMNRWLNLTRVEEAISRIRELRPEVGVGTDIIVGFPGETEHEFEETVEAVRHLHFSYVHVFPFSARAGTPAADLPGALPSKVTKERTSHLIAVAHRLNRSFRRRFLGQTLDGVLLRDGDERSGRALTGNYITVRVPPGAKPGYARMRIDEVRDQETIGTVVDRQEMPANPVAERARPLVLSEHP